MSFVHTITFRLTIWYLLVLGVILMLLSTGVYFHFRHSLYANLDESLEARAAELGNMRGILTSIEQGTFQEELGEVVSLYFYSGGELFQVSARDVDIPYDSQLVEQALAGGSSFATVKTEDRQEVRLYAVPFSPEGPAFFPGRHGMSPTRTDIESAALVIGRSTEEIHQSLKRLRHTIIIAGPLTMIVAGAGGLFLARRALKPVEDIAQTAREIEESDLSQRIKVNTRDELGRLASTVNEMIERLEQAFRRQQQFTADASHELRTPLAIIQAESTLALQKDRTAGDYQDSLGLISQEANHMATIIDQLLTLARADAGKEQFVFEDIPLGELLAELAPDAKLLCREKGLQFQLGSIESLVVRGDRARLKGLFLSLLDNAIRYTPSGGTVSVSLTQEEQMTVVAIRDTGIGIPPEHLSHIFERFYRVDRARSRAEGGSGLGLAICRHIVKAHRGEIKVESQVGEGSTFSVFLPLSQ